MKKKYLLFIVLIAFLGTLATGCVVDRGYYHPDRYHHEHHEHREHERHGGWDD